MYVNTEMAILPLLPMLCICENLNLVSLKEPNPITTATCGDVCPFKVRVNPLAVSFFACNDSPPV